MHGDYKTWDECAISKKPSNNKSKLNDGLDPLFPTREEIEKLAYNNLILYAAMTAKETKGLSWTETLQFTVKHLIEKNNELQEQIIKMAELSTRPLIIE